MPARCRARSCSRPTSSTPATTRSPATATSSSTAPDRAKRPAPGWRSGSGGGGSRACGPWPAASRSGGGAASRWTGGAAAAPPSRAIWPRSPRRPRTSSAGRELGQLVDPQALLDRGHVVHDPLEAPLAEKLVLPPLELVAERAVLPLRDQPVQGGKEDRVLAGLVRAVHADEAAQAAHQGLPAAGVPGHRGPGEAQDVTGHPPSRLVLRAQDGDEVGQRPRLLEPREEMVLLQLLVVLLDEPAHDTRRAAHRVGRQLDAGLQPADRLLVDEQDAVEESVLAHEVLGRRHFDLRGRPPQMRPGLDPLGEGEEARLEEEIPTGTISIDAHGPTIAPVRRAGLRPRAPVTILLHGRLRLTGPREGHSLVDRVRTTTCRLFIAAALAAAGVAGAAMGRPDPHS